MARTLGALALLLVALPFNLALTALALLRGLVVREHLTTAERPRTVLVSGGKMTKALQLARSFHRAGHRVVLVESRKYRFTGHRFSRAVAAFHTVPDPTTPATPPRCWPSCGTRASTSTCRSAARRRVGTTPSPRTSSPRTAR